MQFVRTCGGLNSGKIEQYCILEFVCLRGRTRLGCGGNLWHYLGESWVPLTDRSSKVALSAVNAGLSVVGTFTCYLKWARVPMRAALNLRVPPSAVPVMLRVVDALKYYLLKGARVPMRAHNPTVPLSAGKQT
jgi:hypothetical protein